MDRREMMFAAAATAGMSLLPQISVAQEASEEGAQFDYDVIVVGGGPAGLSAALVLGRCCRKVLVCDAGEHRNRTSPSVHGFFSRDGISPAELLEIGRDQLKPDDVDFHHGRIVDARQLDKGFRVRADSRKTFTASKLILATGVKDDLPHIDGLSDLWGTGVYHCPYCHGWEVRGKPWAYMAACLQQHFTYQTLKG